MESYLKLRRKCRSSEPDKPKFGGDMIQKQTMVHTRLQRCNESAALRQSRTFLKNNTQKLCTLKSFYIDSNRHSVQCTKRVIVFHGHRHGLATWFHRIYNYFSITKVLNGSPFNFKSPNFSNVTGESGPPFENVRFITATELVQRQRAVSSKQWHLPMSYSVRNK